MCAEMEASGHLIRNMDILIATHAAFGCATDWRQHKALFLSSMSQGGQLDVIAVAPTVRVLII